MYKNLLKVSIRNNAILVANNAANNLQNHQINSTTTTLLSNCVKLGFNFSENLLWAVNEISPAQKLHILEALKQVTGVDKNWTPLVKQWDNPTGESIIDHIATWFANVFKSKGGTKMPCGHIIPKGTFPIERYNGCPYCGTPFEFEKLNYDNPNAKLKTLELWTEDDLENYYLGLLQSPVALNATQVDSLKILVEYFGLPDDMEIKIKETLMVVIDALVETDKFDNATKLFKTPNDVLRYLWYKHTGFLQIIEPKTIVKQKTKNASNYRAHLDKSAIAKLEAINELKLKFNRKQCKMYATWLNSLPLDVEKQCEIMHPKRQIWVRVIRALRLAEYSKRKGFEQLAQLLDVFYNENYKVWAGEVNAFKLKYDAENTFALLKQRPGLFARSLFSLMLWFGADITIEHFKQIIDKVPQRLIFTLNMYAQVYFDKTVSRTVKPLGGKAKKIPTNKLLKLYDDEDLNKMKEQIKQLTLLVVKNNLSKIENNNQTMFIDENLFNIPIAIGDRTEHIQDLPDALMGTKFNVEGDTVRLFMQWGNGLPAQHLDMDLSCSVSYKIKTEYCSYSRLVIPGCKHSGDIQHIPNKVGTAEYIDVNIDELKMLGAKYVSFTCNAYTNGALATNMVVGWMDSKYPMKITSNGVAYNPADVTHQVQIKQSLAKGMVFGVLDIEAKQIIWLEMGFGGQIVQNLNIKTLTSFLNKLEAKLKIGDLLKLKAHVHQLEIIDVKELADEVYDTNWALNIAEVSKLFLSDN